MNEQQFCSSCGKPTPADASFCPACGSRLHAQTPLVSPQDIRSKQPARTTSVFVLGLLSILILAPLGIVGWILSGKGTQQIKSGRAKPNALFTAGKVMSIIGTVATGLAIIFGGVIFITSFLQHRTLYTTPGTETSLPIYPTNAAPSVSVPVQETPNMERVSIDGRWRVGNGYGDSYDFDIVGYVSGDLNVALYYSNLGFADWSATGRREGERVFITLTQTNREYNQIFAESQYDLKLISSTRLIGILSFRKITGYYGPRNPDGTAKITGWDSKKISVTGEKLQ
jgi:hypothetical protein